MRFRKPTIIWVIFAVFCAASVQGQSPGSGQNNSRQTSLKPELADFQLFLGAWQCSGEFTRNHASIDSKIVFSPDLEGAWMKARHEDAPPNRYKSDEMWGYDKAGKQFVAVIEDNFGGVRWFTSPGWVGGAMTWTGDSVTSEGKASQRFVYEKAEGDKLRVKWEVNDHGNWRKGDELLCSKKP